MNSRGVRCVGHVARVGERRGAYRFSWENLREGEHLEDPAVGGRIILKWILEKWNRGVDWIDLAQDSDR